MERKYIIMSIDDLLELYKEIQKRYKKIGIIIITKLKYSQPFFITLKLDFLDVGSDQKGFIQKRHVNMIKRALPRIKECKTIIVCCDAGMSRSPAVAAAIAYHLNDWHEYTLLIIRYPLMNQDVKRYIIDNMADVV